MWVYTYIIAMLGNRCAVDAKEFARKLARDGGEGQGCSGEQCRPKMAEE